MTTYNPMDLIPHRAPMLLVDEIVEAVPYEHIVTKLYLPKGHRVFEGHFPDKPILPGMLTIEIMAQAAACLAGISLELQNTESLYYFLGVEKAKFRQMILPETELEIKVKAEKIRGKLCKFAGEVFVEGTSVAEAHFTAMIDIQE